MDGKPRYFANTVLCVLLIWPDESSLTNAFLMCLTKCIHFMQLADLVVASKIVNGKYQHFYISFLVQVFARNSKQQLCKREEQYKWMCILHHRERCKSKIQTGNFPQITTSCFASSRFATHKVGQEKPEGTILLRYIGYIHCIV